VPIKRNDAHPGGEVENGREVVLLSLAPVRAVQQLGFRDGADADLTGTQALESGADVRRAVLDDEDADIGVEQITEGQNSSRS
jgi:hypothetical protein